LKMWPRVTVDALYCHIADTPYVPQLPLYRNSPSTPDSFESELSQASTAQCPEIIFLGETPDLGVIQHILNTVGRTILLWAAMMIPEAVMGAVQERHLGLGACLQGQLWDAMFHRLRASRGNYGPQRWTIRIWQINISTAICENGTRIPPS
jgi:hypothetical protein